jgi:hypothetical protein
MRSTTTIMGLGALLGAAAGVQAYTLHDNFDKDNFFHEFEFFTSRDPTNGFVQYSSAKDANSKSLAGFAQEGVYLGVDYTTVNPSAGRASVRVTSKKSYDGGLFIADFQHMPGSTCSYWGAYWLFGPNWPAGGEIDILEGVNTQTTNAITLHTSPGCVMTNEGSAAGTVLKDGNCNANTAFTGCSQSTQAPFGDSFNDIGGGVYAMEWTSDHIAVWFFPRSNIPADITSGNPNVASWGSPTARFVGGSGCNISKYFKANNIVINTSLCGDWAGKVWSQDAECSALAPTCQEYAAKNPKAFENAYWLINSIKVYQK